MKELVTLNNNIPTTTSLKVAEHFGKRHDHLLRDIETILRQAGTIEDQDVALPNFGESTYCGGLNGNTTMPYYTLDRDAFMLVVMGFTGVKALKFKMDFIQAFNAMEAELAKKNTLPDFSDPVAAARAWADAQEAKMIALKERDEAVKTKAWIGDKRQATAMATASAAVRKLKALEKSIESPEYLPVTALKDIPKYFDIKSRGFWTRLGSALKLMSLNYGYRVQKIPDGRYGEVNGYHKDLLEIFMMRMN